MITTYDPVVDLAQASFGVGYLYPYQRLVVANTLDAGDEGRYQVVVLPTGSGKTLCFTLPMLVLDGVTIVVYPLLALIDDQLRRIEETGIPTRVLRGGQTGTERREIFASVRGGEVRCLLTSPEVLSGDRVRRELSGITIAHLVIDEAHCVSEWGSTFRPAYLTLGETIGLLAPRVVTAFTATASELVLEALCEVLFGDRRPHLVQGDPDRPNISYRVVRVSSKEAALHDLVRYGIEQPAIVFCRSRKRCEGVARELAGAVGFDRCAAYHAGLTREERAEVERWFFDATEGVLAATCAYGMGVDKPNIRTVIHYEVPASVEAFLQESGRAGRDRQPASSIVLWSSADRPAEVDPTRAARERIMHGYLSTEVCRRTYLMEALGANSEICFGCDRCDPADIPFAVDAAQTDAERAREETIRFAARRRRTLTPRRLALSLPVVWSEQARIELVAGLVRDGALLIHRRGPWTGRVSPGRTLRPARSRSGDGRDSVGARMSTPAPRAVDDPRGAIARAVDAPRGVDTPRGVDAPRGAIAGAEHRLASGPKERPSSGYARDRPA